MIFEIPDVPVFAAGDYGEKGKYSEADVQGIAASYDPSWLEAPVTPDHKQEGEAWGWTKSLRAEGGKLFATLRVPEDVHGLIEQGRFRRRSVEIYRGFTLRNGQSALYLKAVSILGAATPAVKGLGPILATAAFSRRQHASSVAIAFNESETPKPRKFDTLQDLRSAMAERADVLELETGRPYLECLEKAERELTGKTEPDYFTSESNAAESFSGPEYSLRLAAEADRIEAANPGKSYRDCLAEAGRKLLAGAAR